MQKNLFQSLVVVGLLSNSGIWAQEWVTPGISKRGNYAGRSTNVSLCDTQYKESAQNVAESCANNDHLMNFRKYCEYEVFLNQQIASLEQTLWDFHINHPQTSKSNSEIKKQIDSLKETGLDPKEPVNSMGKNGVKNISIFEARQIQGSETEKEFADYLSGLKNGMFGYKVENVFRDKKIQSRDSVAKYVNRDSRDIRYFLTQDDIKELSAKVKEDFQGFESDIKAVNKLVDSINRKQTMKLNWLEAKEMGLAMQNLYKNLLKAKDSITETRRAALNKIPIWDNKSEYLDCLAKKYPQCEVPKTSKKPPCNKVEDVKKCLASGKSATSLPVDCVLSQRAIDDSGSSRHGE
jgi:hypothetical protein